MNDSILRINDSILQEEIIRYIEKPLTIYVFDEIDSTNQFAKTLSDDYALILADRQSAGKGRLGRTFFSPKGSGVYLSLKAKITDLYKNVPFITTLASVAVHKAIKALYNIDCGIKWVNDIYINSKKVAGILCEVQDDTHAIIGIGINVYPTPLPEELKDIATHLTDRSTTVTRNKLISEITCNLLHLISQLPSSDFMEYYKSHSILIGKHVTCIQGNLSFPAFCTDISPTGGLVVKKGEELITLTSGEVTIRLKD